MRKKADSTPRESSIASGWTVSGDAIRDAQPNSESVAGVADTATATAAAAAGSDAATGSQPTAGVEEHSGVSPRREFSNMALVLYGVFGGMYLLYTTGWFLIAQYFASVNDVTASTSGAIGGVLQIIIYWAAAFAPAAWFTVVVILSRRRKAWFLPVWLMVGLVVLLPLPLFTTGGA